MNNLSPKKQAAFEAFVEQHFVLSAAAREGKSPDEITLMEGHLSMLKNVILAKGLDHEMVKQMKAHFEATGQDMVFEYSPVAKRA